MPDTTVYFVDNAVRNGVQTFNIYDVQKDEVNVPVYVYCSGFKEETPAVSAVVDETYIDYYNKCYVPVNQEPLKALPSDCYSLDAASVTVANRKARLNVNFYPEKIFSYAKSEGLSYEDMKRYAAPIKLQCKSLEIATYKDTASLGYFLVAPVMNDALIQMAIEKIDALNYDVVVSVPFKNTLDITYDLELGKSEVVSAASGEYGNHYPAKVRFSAFPEGTVVTNGDVRSMQSGKSEVRYAVTFPEGSAGKYPITLSNVVGNGAEMPIVDGEQILDLGVCDLYATSNGIAGINYSGGFAADESALLGKTLNKYGFESYADDNTFIFHPQSSCQYGGKDMCIGTNGVFSGSADDWGVTWTAGSTQPNANLNEDGAWNGGTAAYGYGSQDDKGVMWALVDMCKVQSLCGIEFWRKCGNNAANVKSLEFYALDKCSYIQYNSILEWNAEDCTFLGKAAFGDDNKYNMLAASWENIDTRYLLIAFTAGSVIGYHCVEMDLFHK